MYSMSAIFKITLESETIMENQSIAPETNLFKTPLQQEAHDLMLKVQQHLDTVWPLYTESLKALDPYRGVPITMGEDGNVKEINRILFDIQEKFNMAWPILYYIDFNADKVKTILQEFKDMMHGVERVDANNANRTIITDRG